MKKLILIFAALVSLSSCTYYRNCNFNYTAPNISQNAHSNRIAEIRAAYYATDTVNHIHSVEVVKDGYNVQYKRDK